MVYIAGERPAGEYKLVNEAWRLTRRGDETVRFRSYGNSCSIQDIHHLIPTKHQCRKTYRVRVWLPSRQNVTRGYGQKQWQRSTRSGVDSRITYFLEEILFFFI